MYLWIKALHVMSIIAWMAGLFYLPRLFVYHADAVIGSVQSETFKVMERRLLKAICTPAMIASWVFGLYILYDGNWLFSGDLWVHVKLLFVVLLTVFHGACARWTRSFANDANRHTGRYYRIANEVPTVLMIVIVIMVIVKPF